MSITVEDHATARRHHRRYDLWVAVAEECEPVISGDVRWYPLNDEEYDWQTMKGRIAAQRILEAAKVVAAFDFAGKAVIVSCHMGLNRSGVVAALALVLEGATPDEAVESVRAARGPLALCNRSFVELVRKVRGTT